MRIFQRARRGSERSIWLCRLTVPVAWAVRPEGPVLLVRTMTFRLLVVSGQLSVVSKSRLNTEN